MVDRRTLDVQVARLRVGADQAVEISRLELVRVARERFEIADSVVARARAKRVAEGERRKRRIAAGAAAADRNAFTVDAARFREVFDEVFAVVHVDDAPLAVESLAIGAAVTARAAVVDVGDRPATRRVVLDARS